MKTQDSRAKKSEGPRLVPNVGVGLPKHNNRPDGSADSEFQIAQAMDPRYREMVNVATALRVAWGLLNDPDYHEQRTPVMSLRLMAVVDRALNRLDDVLNCWEVSADDISARKSPQKKRVSGAKERSA